MSQTLRKIVYIRSVPRKRLYFRSRSLASDIGFRYYEVRRLLYANREECFGFIIATDLLLELTPRRPGLSALIVAVPTDAEFTDEPKLVEIDSAKKT